MGVLPAGESQSEVIERMIERRGGNAAAALAHVSKIGQAEPARRMLLSEDDVLLDTVQRPPSADAPLQRAADAGADLGMAPAELVEDGDRPQAGGALEQRHHLAVPNVAQRGRPPAGARLFLL